MKLGVYIAIIIIFLSTNIFANSKIYLIRHAKVQIEKPGWRTTNEIFKYKVRYNTNSVHFFNAKNVLNKIDNHKTINTVFCSPQLRAIQTAFLLFNSQVNLSINDNLKEFESPMMHFPLIKLPTKVWQTITFISWLSGVHKKDKPTYKQRKQNLKEYSGEIIKYAETHGEAVVIAHGVLNHALIKILKKKGWKFENRDGYGNLSVNCLVKK